MTHHNGHPTRHYWTKKEIKEAEHDFAENIKKYFGEVWRIKSDGEYRGKSWDCTHPIQIVAGLWRLCQAVVHTGSPRAAGRIELREHGTVLRFIIFYEPEKKGGLITPKLEVVQ